MGSVSARLENIEREIEQSKQLENSEDEDFYDGSAGTKLRSYIIDMSDDEWFGIEGAKIYTSPETTSRFRLFLNR